MHTFYYKKSFFKKMSLKIPQILKIFEPQNLQKILRNLHTQMPEMQF